MRRGGGFGSGQKPRDTSSLLSELKKLRAVGFSDHESTTARMYAGALLATILVPKAFCERRIFSRVESLASIMMVSMMMLSEFCKLRKCDSP